MRHQRPDWANEKQLEGMEKFIAVADEYGDFDIEFKQSNWGTEDESRFTAVLTWGDEDDRGVRRHEFDIAYDYEETWDFGGERLHEWQFLFAGGDATREVSTEVLFLDLFFYLDQVAMTKAA